MDRVEGYIVDGVDKGLVLGGWRLVTSVTLEGEVVGRILLFNIPIRGKMDSGNDGEKGRGGRNTHWMATRPSILPTAKPFALGKQDTTRVCHFSGDTRV